MLIVAFSGCRSKPAGSAPAQSLAQVEAELSRKQTKDGSYWELCRQKAALLADLGRKEEAAAWFRSLEVTAAPAVERWRIERQWAVLARGMARFPEADSHLAAAIEAAGRAGDGERKASLQVMRADMLISLKQLPLASQLLDEAERADTGKLRPFVQHYRGKILWKTNRFEQALGPLTESFDEFKRLGRKHDAAVVAISLGTCFYRLGQSDKARAAYEEALRLAPEDPQLAVGHLGALHQAQRRFDLAAESFRKAAAEAAGVDEEYRLMWLSNLATSLISENQWDEAERVNRDVLEREERLEGSLGLDHSRVNEASIAAGRGDLPRAAQLLEQLLRAPDVDLGAALDASAMLADVYARSGDAAKAQAQFERALELADRSQAEVKEDENKLSLLESLIHLHRRYVRFLMGRNRVEDALAVAESSRARLLRERMNLPRRTVTRLAEAQYRAIARETGATVLAYWVEPAGGWVWTVTPSGVRVSELASEDALRAQVDRFQAAVENREPEGRGLGGKLFEALVPERARGAARYLIVPDGPLYALNFETLETNGRYWIQDATLAVTPSLDLLAARRSAARRDRSLLAVGDAVEWDPAFEKLVNARKEIETVAGRFAPKASSLLMEAGATPDAYLGSRPRDYAYIHFAAHAMASRDAPMESAIILSRANGRGRLSMRDVLRTPVNANLVTVSACRSAGARTYSGEGLVGLAWAFLQAGAREVVAGLWKVNDYASPKLMERLYAGLAAGESPAAALREAKLKLIAEGKFADPYYWGPLELFAGALPY